MLREELTIRLLDWFSDAFPGVDTDTLRAGLDNILYDYEINARERGLMVTGGFQDKIRLYIASKKLDGLANGTLQNYYRYLVKFSNYMAKELDAVTAIDIRRYLASVATNSDIQKSTMGARITILKSFFSWMQDQEYISKNPMRQIKMIKTEKRMRKSLTSEELERLRDGCETPRERALVEFLFATGCRLSEISALNVADLNWSDMTVRVIGKGSKERQVNFTPKARLYLQKYLNGRKDGALFQTGRAPIGRLTNRSIQKELDRIAKRAGFDKSIHPHLMRHTHATLLLKAGMKISDIADDLGHANIATTMIYAHTDPSNVRHEYQQRMAVG